LSLKYKAAKFIAETLVGGALASAGDKIRIGRPTDDRV